MTFKDISPGLSTTLIFHFQDFPGKKVIFQDLPGGGIFKQKKIQDFPGDVGTLNISGGYEARELEIRRRCRRAQRRSCELT